MGANGSTPGGNAPGGSAPSAGLVLSREYHMRRRRTMLAELDDLEQELGVSPRTSEIREMWRRGALALVAAPLPAPQAAVCVANGGADVEAANEIERKGIYGE